MAEFRRARTSQQRESRRAEIMRVTRELATAGRVADVSLNEIARQVGLAKSNVLRYFGSREAILLELLNRDYAGWVNDIERGAAATQPGGVDDLARLIASAAVRRPLLGDLLSCTSTVLEHNVTVDEVIDFKLRMYAHMDRLTGVFRRHLAPATLDDPGLLLVALHAVIAEMGALAHPSAALHEASRRDGRIFGPLPDHEGALARAVALLLRGAVRTASASPPE